MPTTMGRKHVGGDRSLAIDIGDLRTRVTYRVTMLVCNMLAFVNT